MHVHTCMHICTHPGTNVVVGKTILVASPKGTLSLWPILKLDICLSCRKRGCGRPAQGRERPPQHLKPGFGIWERGKEPWLCLLLTFDLGQEFKFGPACFLGLIELK